MEQETEVEDRFAAYKRKYKELKRRLTNNFGEKYFCSDEDFIKVVTTIEDKKQKDCHFFGRWDTLYGGRKNVNPTSVFRL